MHHGELPGAPHGGREVKIQFKEEVVVLWEVEVEDEDELRDALEQGNSPSDLGARPVDTWSGPDHHGFEVVK